VSASLLPVRFFRQFVETLTAEVGPETLSLILTKSELPIELADPQAASRLSAAAAAEAYANTHRALRIYYGRGARGILQRIGRLLWNRLLENATLQEKAQAQMLRTLPTNMRRKTALELLARFMREKADGATVHSLDMDLLFVDHCGAAGLNQKESGPACSVTLGLIQEALFWATGREADVEETACRAAGSAQCEFKIKFGGK
jgi:predicted hydrocarbon binding protein